MRRTWAIGLFLATSAGCADQVVGTFEGGSTGLAGSESSTSEGVLGTSSGSSGQLETTGDGTSSGAPSASSSDGVGADGTEGTSTGSPPGEPEICDGIDNDLDGLVDEVGAENAQCDTCTLFQGEGQAWWVCTQNKGWETARARCEEYGAQLAIVPDEASQNLLLENVMGMGTFFWIGGRRDDSMSPWGWVDGSAFVYDAWAPTQPDNIDPGQHCVRMTVGLTPPDWFDGAWDDFFCNDGQFYVCAAPHTL